MPPRRPSIAASSVALALVAGACRLDPPAMPGKDVAAHVEEEATGRGLRAAEAQAQEAVRKAREAEAEATALRDRAIADIHRARDQALVGLDERIDQQVELASRHVLG